MKTNYLYFAGICTGIALLVYYYVFNFDSMSETELVNSVLNWYAPLIFGVYGLIALRIKSKMGDSELSLTKFLISGKDGMLLMLFILIGCGGLIGFILLLIPLSIFKVQSANFDFKVALVGTALCIVLLWVFFQVLWPAL